LIIGICNLDIVCSLSIAIWNFSAPPGYVNRFNLNQLELALTSPWVILPCDYIDTGKMLVDNSLLSPRQTLFTGVGSPANSPYLKNGGMNITSKINPQRPMNDLRHLKTIGKHGPGVVHPALSTKDMEARQ